MDPSLALFISIAVILILIRFINISLSILAGAFILGFLSTGFESLNQILIAVTSLETLKIVAIVVLAFTLGYSMEYFGLLQSLTDSISSMTGMLSLMLIPLIVGLLPMPGGALISAVMLANLIRDFGVGPERATYINYWFRHLWVTVWPLYPNIIVGTAVVESSYTEVFLSTYPIALISIISGLIFTHLTGGMSARIRISIKDLRSMISSFYPVILVAFMALTLKIDLFLTLILSLGILFLHKRIKIGDIKPIFKKTIDFNIIILVFAVMIYKELIEYTSSAEIFFTHLQELSLPPSLASFILSFVIGFSTGVEISYTSIALPLLTGFTGTGDVIHKNLMLVFGAGYLGVMLSPLHLCLVFSADYYKANLYRVYKILAPTGVLFAVLLILLFLLI